MRVVVRQGSRNMGLKHSMLLGWLMRIGQYMEIIGKAQLEGVPHYAAEESS